jgi:hypothetical protein
MKYAICVVPVSPLRAEPSHKSEMVSQLLFGEFIEVKDTSEYWMKVNCRFDGYEGWVQCNQVEETTMEPVFNEEKYVTDWMGEITINGDPMKVPLGSCVYGTSGEKLKFGKMVISYLMSHPWDPSSIKPSPQLIEERCRYFLNTPYLWGGKSVFGIDCSGFTQTTLKFFNIRLLRDAYLQATQGETIRDLGRASCGDLAFFENSDGKITHVGILLGNGEIIHASGRVRIDRIDETGIINKDSCNKTHNLCLIKRYFSTI